MTPRCILPRAASAARGAAALTVLLLLAACAAATAPAPPPGLGARLLDDVPFFPQDDFHCGPSVLASLLGYAGDPVTPEEVAAAVFREDLRGTLTLDMGLYPRTRGHASTFGPGRPGELTAAIDAGRPVGVMVNLGFSAVRRLHFMTIVGYTPRAVIAHSAALRATHIPWETFLARWESAGRWMLTIGPGDAP